MNRMAEDLVQIWSSRMRPEDPGWGLGNDG